MSNTSRWNRLATILVTLVLTAFFTSTFIYIVFTGTSRSGFSYSIRHNWELFTDNLAKRQKLAEVQIPEVWYEEQDNVPHPYNKDYAFSAIDWFTYNIPVWEIALAPYKGKPDVRYLEIGTYEGRSLIWMFENILTDPTSTAANIDIFYGMDNQYAPDVEARFHANLELSGAADRTRTLVGFSYEKLRELYPETFDIIYIDGGHRAPTVLKDAILAGGLLKVGGLMIFDDYRVWMEFPPEARPKLGVDTFVRFFNREYEVIHDDYQFIVRKLREPILD